MSGTPRQRIAIIGSGIAGLSAAWFLHKHHDITIFEAGDHIGGHTHTHQLPNGDSDNPVDSGFIVHNELNYPELCRLFQKLGVATRNSDMSFSNRLDGHEWRGGSLHGLFAQKRNLFKPKHWLMIRDILRFHQEAEELAEKHPQATLADLPLTYGEWFRQRFLHPITGAIWSQPSEEAASLPLGFVVRFMQHHRMLQTGNRPTWRTIVGGSKQYIAPMIKDFADRIHLHTPVQTVQRQRDGTVRVVTMNNQQQDETLFDSVIMACHSDQALQMLHEPTAAEQVLLAAIPYRANTTTIHHDSSLMPRSRRAWAAWNVHPGASAQTTAVTYDLTHLQGLPGPKRFFVSLEAESLLTEPPVRTLSYAHPQLTEAGVTAQDSWHTISGVDRIHYCGAYWGFGFHEDGFVSGRRVANALGGGW